MVRCKRVTNIQLLLCESARDSTKWALKHASEEFMVIGLHCVQLYYAYLRNFNRYLISLSSYQIQMAIPLRAVLLHFLEFAFAAARSHLLNSTNPNFLSLEMSFADSWNVTL